jgi:hypothetical protein
MALVYDNSPTILKAFARSSILFGHGSEWYCSSLTPIQILDTESSLEMKCGGGRKAITGTLLSPSPLNASLVS